MGLEISTETRLLSQVQHSATKERAVLSRIEFSLLCSREP